MKNRLLTFWYFSWKMVASLGLRMYFSSMQVRGLRNVPKDNPVILAVNHQNSFLDAIIVACILKRKSYFLARGDVFRKKWAYAMLSSLGIMPIFRSRDGLGKVRNNTTIFEACTNILASDGAVMIFPEGNHYMRWSLRPLQRGIARIAFQSLDKSSKSLLIIPVGIQYEDHMKAASRVLVQIGDPLEVDTYEATDDADNRTKMDLLIHDLRHSLSQLILDIPEEDYENIVQKLRAARTHYPDQVQQLKSDQQIVDALLNNQPIELRIPQKGKSIFAYLVYLLVPFGWLTHIIPRSIISGFVKWKVKDPQFIAPLNYALGLVIYPLNGIIWGSIAAYFFGPLLGLATIILVFALGKLTLRFWH